MGTFPDYLEAMLKEARRNDWTTGQACEHWASGAYLLETVPSALWILARHAHDPEEAIVRAVNDTHDNDTVAAIVGAAVGALHGRDALPASWQRGLLGRTNTNDDGRVFRLIEAAVRHDWT
jgi:ADP-ribosylglycohydrolase